MAHTPALFPWALTGATPERERNSVLFPDPVFPKIPTSTDAHLPLKNTATYNSCVLRLRTLPSAAPPRRGTPFVARRAVNLHGCALPHCAPLLRRLRRTLRSLVARDACQQ